MTNDPPVKLVEIAIWLDHLARLTLAPSLPNDERLAWQRHPCVSVDAPELLRRVEVAASSGHMVLTPDPHTGTWPNEHHRMMIQAARRHAAALPEVDHG